MNILIISPDFNYSCGVSKHIFELLKHYDSLTQYNVFFITNRGDALFRLEKAGINYSLINFKTGKLFHFDFLKNISVLKTFCIEKEINLIHSHHRYPALLAHFVSKSLGIKTITTVHNFVTGFKSFSYKSDTLISISNSVKDHLINYFDIPTDKVKVMYNCVLNNVEDLSNSKPLKAELCLPPDSLVLFFTGRINREKGIQTLYKAFNSISKENKKVFLLLIGDNQLSSEFSSILGNDNKVRLLPAKENVQHFYHLADLIILPSVKEPFGYIMLEAGLHKIPFIGSRNGGIDEFIDDGVNGFLFEPGNAAELAKKIKYVLEHPVKAKISALKLHEKVLELCSCKEYFMKLTNIYHSLFENDFMKNKD